MDTGGETPSTSSLSNAASSSPSSGSGRPHSAGAVFSFNIPLGSDTEAGESSGQSQELLAIVGNEDDEEEEEEDDGEEGEVSVDLLSLTAHYIHDSNSNSDTMLFLLPSAESHHHHHHSGSHSHQTPLSADSPQVRRHTGVDTDRSPSENKENTAPNSPLVASANYKQGNYFRFPDVDGWSTGAVAKLAADQLSSCSTPSDTLTLGILSPPDVLLPEAPRNSPMRRARLKSISLDSESAKVVEDNLNVGMQDLCLQPPPPTELYHLQEHSEISGSSSSFSIILPESRSFSQSNHSFRNKNQLKIDLKHEEYNPEGSGVDSRQHPPTPKTPTLTQSRQKAISLDSDQGGSKPATETSTNCCVPTVSASVPTTPKRHLILSTHQPHGHHPHRSHHHGHHHHQKSSHHAYHHSHQQHSNISSNVITSSSGSCRTKSRSTSEHLGSNLQRLKTVTLSVSNNNLKTLPEVMPLSDFGSTTISPPTVTSSPVIPLTLDGPPFAVSPNIVATTPSKGRSSLLQRRGSNHSLTLNLAGSVGDLSGSTSHIAPSASGSGFGTKRGLLQRRGSNASLTLNIQGSDSALSRFNSHGSLNEGRVHRKSLLSVSNCNLRSSMDVSRLRSQAGDKAGHRDKFFSSEENLNNNNNVLSYCHIEPIDVVGDSLGMSSTELVDFDEDGVRQITTKPLSPQSTSEDFKIYLANIQYLQNATNVLHVDDIRDLGTVFDDLGAYMQREQELGGTEAATRLTTEQEKHLSIQRRKLREIQQEFWDLPTNHQEKPMVFGSQHKNRYKTILPNEHSRVILKPELADVTKTEPYINANYIKGPTDGTHELNYIATQGPMANTVFDFWLMAMQDAAGELGPTGGNQTHNKSYSASCADNHLICPLIIAQDVENDEGVDGESKNSSSRGSAEKVYIVMLTNFVENGRPKCATYFPEQLNQTLCFFSGSGSESQSEASCRIVAAAVDCDVESDEAVKYREWYEQFVKDKEDVLEDRAEWEWVKCLRKTSSCEPSASSLSRLEMVQRESCFLVRNVGVREKTGYSVRDLCVKYVHGPARICYKFDVEHYWFPDWPDHKSPGDLSVVLDFALDLLKVPGLTMSGRTPDTGLGTTSPLSVLSAAALTTAPKVVLPILHCSAGIGRTGCFSGILNALRQMIHSGTPHSSSCGLNTDATTVSSPSQSQTVDILGIVCNLRLQRGGMVQNSEQYELIHRVLCLYQQKVDESNGVFPAVSFLQRDCSSD